MHLGDHALRCSAAETLLWSGHADEGRALLVEVLAAVGVRVPRWRWAMLLLSVVRRIASRLRAPVIRSRSAASADPGALRRIDTLARSGFAMVISDQELGWSLLSQAIYEAPSRGDVPLQINALAAEGFICHLEPGGIARSAACFAVAEEGARAADLPGVLAWVLMYRAVAAVQLGRIAEARTIMSEARETYASAVPGSTSWLAWADLFLAAFRGYQGDLDGSARALLTTIEDAQARGDVGIEVHAWLGMGVAPDLILDDPDACDAHATGAIGLWSQARFDLMHFYATITRMRVRLYRGDTAGALALLQAHRHDVRRSGALNSGSNRVMWAAVAGSVIAVAVREGPLPRSALREATQLAKGVHWPDSWFGAWAHVVFAAVAQVNGEPERALADLDRVEAIAVEQEVHTWVDLARYRRAQIRRDAEGLDAARAALRARGARDPDRWVASWCGELDG